MAARGPEMAGMIWKGVYFLVFGHSLQLSHNKFFNLGTPSMKKGCDGEVIKVEKNSKNSGPPSSCQSNA